MLRTLTPEETREHSIFTLFGKEGAGVVRWLMLTVLAVIAWIGGVGFLGQYRPTQVSKMVAMFAPLDQVYWGALGAAGVIALLGLAARRNALAWVAIVVTVYLAGFYLSGQLYRFFPPGFHIPFAGNDDAWRFALSRLWFGAPIVGLMVVAWLAFRWSLGPLGLSLGFGDWSVRSRDVSRKEEQSSWLIKMITGYSLFLAALALFVHWPVGFAPIFDGTLWALLPAVLIAAAINAIVEELVYRGFIQPAFVRYGGVAAGLWMQGMFFGIIHWGLSVGILAALPVSLLIGLGSVVWGKAAYETRGLGWTIVAHFLVDVVIMAAYFVPH